MKGQFVTIQNAGSWNGRLGCVIGKTRKQKFPWEVSLIPKKDDGCGMLTVTVREDQIVPYNG